MLLGIVIGVMAILLSAVAVVARPLAHERIVSGDDVLTPGWLDEPPVAGNRK
jgi:hypothetical protein